jgi:hypothetical protein
MLRTVLYQSTAKTDFPSTADHNILKTAWRHNGEMGVTGYLLRTQTQYFQVLEAGDDVLDDLVGMIRKDPRHADMEILCDNTINKRRFANWTMGYHLLTESERDDFDGWLKYGDDFAHSVISYMQLMAKRSKVASSMG